MLAQISNIDPRIITALLTNPSQIPAIIDPAIIALSAKILLLTVMGFYAFFSFVVYVQVRRLETWLLYLKRWHFSAFMLVQLIMVIAGWLVALIVL